MMGDRKRVTIGIAALLLSAALSVPGQAATPGLSTGGIAATSVQGSAGGVWFSLAGSLGAVGGTAYERSYAPEVRDFKISELKWDLKNLATVGIEGEVSFPRVLGAFFRFRSVVNEGDGEMVDRDWLYVQTVTDDMWTHQSVHPDTSVDKGTMLDLGLTAGVPVGSLRLAGVLGYRSDDWKWTSRGGTFIYSDIENGGFRDWYGTFAPGARVIEYEQEYSYPYAGIRVEGGRGIFDFSAQALYSPFVNATDSDYHVLRDTRFEGDFSGGDYVGIGFTATWAFTQRFYAGVGLDYQRISETKGDVVVRGPTPEESGTYPDGGSVELTTTAISALAGFRF